jgi:hypothetical protein
VGKLIRNYLLPLLLVLCQLPAAGEARMYTRKARLQDFTVKTTRVVLTGQEVFDAVLKEEIASRWMASPYEFCTVHEYMADKNSNMYYFLRFAFDADYTYMVLSKSGDPESEDQLKQGFDVVMLPVAPARATGGDELVFMPAYIDIVQHYVMRARESEKVAYRGLKGICSRPAGIVYSDREEALKAFSSEKQDANVRITIPSAVSDKKRCEFIISTDTHELRGYKRK